ncbi:MAG TPA: SET domain-containing protein [Pyrinomonadaceae bacterium]
MPDAEQICELSCACRAQIKKYTYRDKHTNLYVLCGDDARFFNHSAAPNCLDICDGGENDITTAARDINAGEELTCDYALFDMDLIDGFYSI